MNAKTILTLFCLLQFLGATAQYNWSNPQPSGHINHNVHFTDDATGYIMNTDGDLIKTTDGGVTWKIFRNFPRCEYMDIQDSFFVVGGADTTIYTSKNRGQTWTKGFIDQNQLINHIEIIDKDTVFAVSKHYGFSTTQLFRSVNGGASWQVVNNSFDIKSIDFIDSKLAYAASFGGIYKTTDGGVSWQRIHDQPSSGYPFMTLAFYNKDTGFAYRDLGELVRTVDGGKTWTVCLPSVLSRIYTISFADASTVFLGGEDGVIYRSTDGGQQWLIKPYRLAGSYSIFGIHMRTVTRGFFVGHRGQILKTTDGGDTYQPYSPTYTDIKPLAFPTPDTGYAATWTELFKTTDGGQSWSKLAFTAPDPNNNRFQQLHFFSKDTGIATLENQVQLFKTYDGGQNWQPVVLPLPHSLRIYGFFVRDNTLYLSVDGYSGSAILQSMDRGESWRIQTMDATAFSRTFSLSMQRPASGRRGPSCTRPPTAPGPGRVWVCQIIMAIP